MLLYFLPLSLIGFGENALLLRVVAPFTIETFHSIIVRQMNEEEDDDRGRR